MWDKTLLKTLNWYVHTFIHPLHHYAHTFGHRNLEGWFCNTAINRKHTYNTRNYFEWMILCVTFTDVCLEMDKKTQKFRYRRTFKKPRRPNDLLDWLSQLNWIETKLSWFCIVILLTHVGAARNTLLKDFFHCQQRSIDGRTLKDI